MRIDVLLIVLFLAANGRAASYSSSFPNTETPLAGWIQGQATGGSWKNVNSIPGMAYGTQSGAGGYDDSTAVLNGVWGPDQSAQATVVIRSPTINIAEAELRLRTTITPGRITGYEFNYSIASGQSYAQIVRWNGPLGSFVLIDSRPVTVKSGDVVKATAVGNVLTTYVNGAARFSVTDSTFKSGSPGIGFYVSTGGINQNFGLTNFSASDSGPASTPAPSPIPTPGPAAGTFDTWKTQLLNEVDTWIQAHPPKAD